MIFQSTIPTYKEVVSPIDIKIRPIITRFMAWYNVMEDKTGSDIKN